MEAPETHSEVEQLCEVIRQYRNRANITRRAQYIASGNSERKNLILGLPVVFITALVGTAIFGTLQNNPATIYKILTGIISVAATILAALQTYLGYSEKAAKQKESGARYASIWRSLDVLDIELQMKGPDFVNDAIDRLKNITQVLDEVGAKSPSIPDYAYRKAREELTEVLEKPPVWLRTKTKDELAHSKEDSADRLSKGSA